MKNVNEFENIISPNATFKLKAKILEIIKYHELIIIFVKKDFKVLYKQTILGPLLYVIQPIILSFTFTLIFNNIGSLNTGATPNFLFNLTGITLWNYFSACLTATTNTFQQNAESYSKVYFPRIILPISNIITYLIRFLIQITVVLIFFIYYKSIGVQINLYPSMVLLIIPVFILGLLSIGLGMIFTTIVSKYKDLTTILPIFIQFLMFISAVMYPLSLVYTKMSKYTWVIIYNPISYIIETGRCLFLHNGNIPFYGLFYSITLTILIFITGFIVFHKKERIFLDTI